VRFQPAIHDLAEVRFFLDIPRASTSGGHRRLANLWQTFRIVICPWLRPGLTVATLFSLLLPTTSLSSPIVLTGIKTKTLPARLLSLGGEDRVGDCVDIGGRATIGIMLPIVIL